VLAAGAAQTAALASGYRLAFVVGAVFAAIAAAACAALMRPRPQAAATLAAAPH